MLQRKFRLTRKSDFQKVLKDGRRVHGKFFMLFFLESASKEDLKVGLIVSNKVSKLAVVRNKIRRYLREVIRQNIDLLLKGFNLVFMAKGVAAGAGREDISRDVLSIFKKSQLTK